MLSRFGNQSFLKYQLWEENQTNACSLTCWARCSLRFCRIILIDTHWEVAPKTAEPESGIYTATTRWLPLAEILQTLFKKYLNSKNDHSIRSSCFNMPVALIARSPLGGQASYDRRFGNEIQLRSHTRSIMTLAHPTFDWPSIWRPWLPYGIHMPSIDGQMASGVARFLCIYFLAFSLDSLRVMLAARMAWSFLWLPTIFEACVS